MRVFFPNCVDTPPTARKRVYNFTSLSQLFVGEWEDGMGWYEMVWYGVAEKWTGGTRRTETELESPSRGA